MDSRLQSELNVVISKINNLGNTVKRNAKKDMNSAAEIVALAARQNAPKSGRPHRLFGNTIRPGTLKKAIVRIPLRRARVSAVVGIKAGKKYGARDGFYGAFVERGTQFQSAQRFLERAAAATGGEAQSYAIQLLIKRISEFEKGNFK